MNLRIELRRSPRLVFFLSCTHLGAMAILPWLEIAPGWRAALGAAVLGSFAWYWKRYVHRGADAVVALQVSADGEWTLRRAGAGMDEPAKLVSYFSHPAVVVLRLKTETGRVEPAILMSDTQDAETLRQLRMRLAAPRSEKKDTGYRSPGSG